jgi:hypothetical protein
MTNATRRALMPDGTMYGVKFVGYAAYVYALESGHEVHCATLDFVCGAASVCTDGGLVMAPSRCDLGECVRTLPQFAHELRQLQNGAVSTGNISLSHRQDTVWIAADVEVNSFIQQITKRFIEVEEVLAQADKIGLRIKRRPYQDFIDEIEETGIVRCEIHGGGLFVNGKLLFYPDYQVGLLPGTC